MYSQKQRDEGKKLYGDERGEGIQKVYDKCHNQQRRSAVGKQVQRDENNEFIEDDGEKI